MIRRGVAHKYGSNIDTDTIIAGRFCNITEPLELANHCFEDLDPTFVKKVKRGDIIVAENNFGCGSSRELAPLSIKYLGISCVIAKTFARIFYRNAINIGLPILESPDAASSIKDSDQLEIDLAMGKITNLTSGKIFYAARFPPFIQKIIKCGGLIAYLTSQNHRLKPKAAKKHQSHQPRHSRFSKSQTINS